MNQLDQSLEKLKSIFSSFASFLSSEGASSEADTRHKIIDRILHEVLLWPHERVRVEPRADTGYVDYILSSATRPLIIIEAKKAGDSWKIPSSKFIKNEYSLSGVIKNEKPLISAIEQAQGYCNDLGIRYAVASNGYSFVLFRAISENAPWRDGKAIVFSSPDSIIDGFAAFWNLLSYETALAGSLDHAFMHHISQDRLFDRPLSYISNENALYGRNFITSLLQPYMDTFFGDIAAQTSEEILESCYVYSKPLMIVDQDLKLAIEDEIPRFARAEGFQQLEITRQGDEFAKRLKSSERTKNVGGFVILMGGIGCGKSTYLRLFFNKFKRESVAGRSHVIFLDYLGYSSNLSTLRDFTFTKIANDIKSQPGVVARDVLELMYRDEIQILKTTKLYGITDEARLSEEIGNFLYEELRNPDSFSQKALSSLLIARVLPILVFDNVDQLPLEIQIEIFSMAQYFSRQIGCLSVLALREESYCTARMQKVFTAYTLNKYHLSSPSLKKLIEVRINMALKKLSYDNPTNIHVAGKDVSTHDVANFLKVVHANILEKHKPLFTFIQSLAYGNMRLALSMLNTFMTSGTTDVGKILYKYLHQRDPYKVPFHEFVKSITLGEFRYFKEDRSPVTNIYDVQAAPNSSHFTGIRLLRYLDSRRNNRSPEGQGFVDIHEIVYAFDELFHNLEDIRHTIQKFIVRNKQLVELDTRMTDTISGASYIRITPSGVFYINELYKRFVYLDLVWQDTPFSNPSISQELARQINRLDLEERFRRVEIFLKYLQDEENQEVNKFTLDDALGILAEKVMPTLLKSFRGEIGYIRSHRRVY